MKQSATVRPSRFRFNRKKERKPRPAVLRTPPPPPPSSWRPIDAQHQQLSSTSSSASSSFPVSRYSHQLFDIPPDFDHAQSALSLPLFYPPILTFFFIVVVFLFFFFFFFFFDLSFLLEIIIIIVAIFLVFDSRGCHRHLVVAVILFIYLFLCQSLSFFLCLSLPVSACLCLSLLSLRAMELIQQKFGWMVWRADHFFGILPRPVGFIQFERFRHSKATLDFWFVLLLLLLLLLVLLFWLIPLELLDCFSRRFRIQFPSFLDKSSQKQRDKTERNESYQYCSRWDSYSNDPFSFHRHSWRPLGWIEGFVPSVWLNCSIFCCCCFDF